jgi:hypothetical protein
LPRGKGNPQTNLTGKSSSNNYKKITMVRINDCHPLPPYLVALTAQNRERKKKRKKKERKGFDAENMSSPVTIISFRIYLLFPLSYFLKLPFLFSPCLLENHSQNFSGWGFPD